MSRLALELERCYPGYTAVLAGRGISALYLALSAIRESTGPGEVIVPATVCPSVALAVCYAGLEPRFCDVELDTLCMSTDTIRTCITERTRAIVVVYLFGKSIDVGPIVAMARDRDIMVIEDLAQAVGGSHGDWRLGSQGDFTVLSFSDLKILPGSGGALLVRDARTATAINHRQRSLPMPLPLRQRSEIALGFRNLTHGCYDSLRANSIGSAVSVFPAMANLFRRGFVYRHIEPDTQTTSRQIAALQSLPEIRERRYERYQLFARELADGVGLVTFSRDETCWRAPALLPTHAHQLDVIRQLRSMGKFISNHYFPASFLFGDSNATNARAIGMRAVNFSVDGNEVPHAIPGICQEVNRICRGVLAC